MSKKTVGRVKTMGLKCEWAIENYRIVSQKSSTGVAFCSPPFSTVLTNGKRLNWQLQIYPNGIEKAHEDYVSVYLKVLNEENFSTSCSISMLDCVSISISEFNAADQFVDREIFIYNPLLSDSMFDVTRSWGWARYYPKIGLTGNRNKFSLTNDTMVLCCTFCSVDIVESIAQKSKIGDSLKFDDHDEYLLESGDLSDVTLIIGDRCMHLHKVILSRVSPVFRAMFSRVTSADEKKDPVKRVKINSEISYDVMKEMLRYIYAKKVNGVESIAGELYVAAHKYAVDGLKKLCEEQLCRDLNNDNAHERLRLAVKYDMPVLKPKVVEFVVRNLKDFTVKEQFQNVEVECTREILKAIAVKVAMKKQVESCRSYWNLKKIACLIYIYFACLYFLYLILKNMYDIYANGKKFIKF